MTVPLNTAAAAPRTELFEDKDSLCRAVAERLIDLLRRTVAEDGAAHVALTGGGAGIGTLVEAARLFRSGAAEGLDLSAVHLWWGDERLLPAGDAERNAQQADEALLDLLVAEHGLPAANIHRMPSSEDAASPRAGAELYAEQLALHAPEGGRAGLHLPRFAVILLGVGPDGHIASLFPGKAALQVTGRTTVGEDDSPKPPPPRVSLTFDAIHSAERVWLVVAGQDKAEAVRRAADETTEVTEIPAKNARGARETVWHVDRAAAGHAQT
ncbi:6-phosphogluconolactonase [Nesterenkonia sp. CL21]|uniref:6-phosphogluconolactonase n=1 Tax=unclassified Nesterenkonia TaxID=2629769 RepID=UPI00287B1022|nr:6-phosphogluconolactonase [Nesterenkonia sp. CL21]MDS2171672.1 6-phosphogluconolactonase [Nesterenkonia sp. CL21]